MEGLEFHSHSLGFSCESAVLPHPSLPAQLRPVLIPSSCYSSRISNQNPSGKDTGGGVCCAECLGKYLLLIWIIQIGISKLCPAQSQHPAVPGSGGTQWDESSFSEICYSLLALVEFSAQNTTVHPVFLLQQLALTVLLAIWDNSSA